MLVARANVHQVDRQGRTPLLRAALFNKKANIIDVLMEHNANINDMDTEKNNVLHYAARHGSIEVIQSLIRYGASPYSLNEHG